MCSPRVVLKKGDLISLEPISLSQFSMSICTNAVSRASVFAVASLQLSTYQALTRLLAEQHCKYGLMSDDQSSDHGNADINCLQAAQTSQCAA